jgi:hypothetical protein
VLWLWQETLPGDWLGTMNDVYRDPALHAHHSAYDDTDSSRTGLFEEGFLTGVFVTACPWFTARSSYTGSMSDIS